MTADAAIARPGADLPVRLESHDGGAVWRVVLATPRANLLDLAKILALTDIFTRARAEPALKAIVIDAEGSDFSFGASVEEHLPGQFETMIPLFGALFDRVLAAGVVTLAAVRGRCLGGGLELAAFCNRVFCAPDALLGQPEIVLGVFAPVASVFLVDRIGRGATDDLLLTGRSLGAAEALRIGLVDALADDPTAAAFAYARDHLLSRSASSLRLAARAARSGLARRFRLERREAERIYLEELMSTGDAREGLAAFLDRRPPVWRNA